MQCLRVLSPIACAVVLASTPVLASPAVRRARLDWTRGPGAESCVAPAALERAVATRLGRNPFGGSPDLAIEGAITRESSQWIARFTFHDGAGKPVGARELASRTADCEGIGDTVALTLAIAIDPDAALRAKTPGDSPPSSQAPAAAPPPESNPPRPVEDAPWAVQARASGVLVLGLVPGPAPGAAVGVDGRVARSWLHLGVEMIVVPARSSDDGGFAFGLTTLDAAGCIAPPRGGIRWRGCVLLSGGLLHAYAYPSTALAIVEPGDFAWAAVGGAVGISIPLAGPFTLEPVLTPLVLLARRQAVVRGRVDPAYEQSPVALVASLGIGLRP